MPSIDSLRAMALARENVGCHTRRRQVTQILHNCNCLAVYSHMLMTEINQAKEPWQPTITSLANNLRSLATDCLRLLTLQMWTPTAAGSLKCGKFSWWGYWTQKRGYNSMKCHKYCLTTKILMFQGFFDLMQTRITSSSNLDYTLFSPRWTQNDFWVDICCRISLLFRHCRLFIWDKSTSSSLSFIVFWGVNWAHQSCTV